MSKTTRRLKPFTRFESIALRLAPGTKRPAALARTVLRNILDGDNWDLVPLSDDGQEFEAVPKSAWRIAPDRAVARAWERVYELRADARVESAEPLFAFSFGDPPAAAPDDDPGTDDDFEWSLDAMCVKEAWDLFDNGDPGDGVTVGHPDTGFTEHFEIFNMRLRADDGHNYEEDNDDAHDTLAEHFGRNPGGRLLG